MDKAELLAATDKLFNSAIMEGVTRDAVSALDNKRYRAAVIQTYCGIDAMASLMRDAKSSRVNAADFVAWVERYMHFNVDGGPTGLEVYGARCGLLHANEAESALSKAGKARMIGYVDVAEKPVLVDSDVKDLILISTKHLVLIFVGGVRDSWRTIKAEPDLLALVHERLQKLHAQYYLKDL